MRALVSCSLRAFVLLCVLPTIGSAQQSQIPMACHPWGRFPAGAWKLVRVVTETLDEQGNVTGTSTTETKTTLKEVNGTGVVLEVEVVVEIAGKRLDAQPQIVKQGLHGELADTNPQVKDLGSGEVNIEGRKIPCQVEQVETHSTGSKTRLTTYWTAKVSPFILRRESVTTDVEQNGAVSQSTVDVVTLDMPCKVLSEMKNASHVKAVVKHSRGTTTTFSVTSSEIPGGVVFHTAKELDEKGRLVRRSSLELIDYGLQADEERTGLLRRWRNRLQNNRRLHQD